MADRSSSPSQRALESILGGTSEAAHRLRAEPVRPGGLPIHRTKLWFYSTGRGRPNVETAAFIERVTGGAVPANGWTPEPDATAPTDPAPAPVESEPGSAA